MGFFSKISGADRAKEAAERAAQAALGGQQDAMDFLQDRGGLAMGVGDAALSKLAALYGLDVDGSGGGMGMFDQQAMLDAAMKSPIYDSIMGTMQGSEEALMRQAAATGGLRSGNMQDALARNAAETQQKALMASYGQQLSERDKMASGLGGLAGAGSGYTKAMADLYERMGMTEAQGIAGAEKAYGDAMGGLAGGLGGLVGGLGSAWLGRSR